MKFWNPPPGRTQKNSQKITRFFLFSKSKKIKASTYALERSAHDRPSARELFLGGTRPLQKNISKKLKKDEKNKKNIFFSKKKFWTQKVVSTKSVRKRLNNILEVLWAQQEGH